MRPVTAFIQFGYVSGHLPWITRENDS